MEIIKDKDGLLKIRYGSLWGTPKVKIDVSEYEFLINRDNVLKGIETQLDSEKWDVSIIGIKDLEPYIEALQETREDYINYITNTNGKLKIKDDEIIMLKEHITLNAKPFIPSKFNE